MALPSGFFLSESRMVTHQTARGPAIAPIDGRGPGVSRRVGERHRGARSVISSFRIRGYVMRAARRLVLGTSIRRWLADPLAKWLVMRR